jgi:hypothetical protein
MDLNFVEVKIYIYFVLQSTFNMNSEKYLQDLKDIRSLMHKSSRFISLSGLSGILAGVYALLGSIAAYRLLDSQTLYLRSYNADNLFLVYKLLGIAIGVAVLAITTALILTIKNAQKNKEKIWDKTTQMLLIHFLIPLLTGAIFGLILLKHEHFGIIAPISLIFYGLALVNASKFTLDTVKYLGISEVIVGLIAAYFVGYGLYFWAFGFGVLHIVYGSIMYFKENK